MDHNSVSTLEQSIEAFFAQGSSAIGNAEAEAVFHQLRYALETGNIRAAEPDETTALGWRVNAWVKRGILLGFRLGTMVGMESGALSFVDKNTYPARTFLPDQGVRVVPGGSSVRSGAYLARSVVCMPPMYVNVGAYVDEGTMVDSHALVGSCAQIGKRVHLSAAAQIGGVLEPVNASPVIIEDDVLIGGNTGVYEGTVVRSKAVLAAGTVLTRGTPVYDLVNGTILKAERGFAADHSFRRGRRAGLARDHPWQGPGVGAVAGDSCDCEVSRRKDRAFAGTGGFAALRSRAAG